MRKVKVKITIVLYDDKTSEIKVEYDTNDPEAVRLAKMYQAFMKAMLKTMLGGGV